MAGHKAVITSQMYRQYGRMSTIHGLHKAAKITGSSLPEKPQTQRERWDEVLQMYGDYFIRY